MSHVQDIGHIAVCVKMNCRESPGRMIEKILLINDLTLAITNGKRWLKQGFERFEKRNVLYGVQKSKVVDHKMVCSLTFFVSLKVPVWPEKTGKDPVDVHDIAISGRYNIDRFRDEKWIGQDPGIAPVTKAQIDTLLSYWAMWWVREDPRGGARTTIS